MSGLPSWKPRMDADDVSLAQAAACLNGIAAYLALDDLAGSDPAAMPVDCVILAGNSVLATAEGAFRAAGGRARPLLVLSGGIGHSTELLWQAVAAHDTYRAVPAHGRPEAAILADIARTFWGIDPSRILVEDASAHCGENAAFSRRILERSGHVPRSVLLVQDPTMQRRTDATFRHVWRDMAGVAFLNWPTFVPRVAPAGGVLAFADPGIAGLWPMDRFVTLVMGEIPRLRNDAGGYGPNGRGFIAPVEIPARIEAAYAALKEGFGRGFGARAAVRR